MVRILWFDREVERMPPVEPGANRRASPRRPLKGATKVRCFRGPMGLGANLAFSAVNVSEIGANLVVTGPFQKDEEVVVALESIVQLRPVQRKAIVVWCEPAGAGRWRVGVKFQTPLHYAELTDLARL
jgi:hypothetical protein